MAYLKKHRVVVGVDFTSPSDAALSEALRLAGCGAVGELHAVYVVSKGDLPDSAGKTEMEVIGEILERAPDHLRLKLLDVATAMGVTVADVETFVHVRIGEHADSIHQVAVDYDADLIIVGSHNRKLIDRLVLGSVSEKLVREAHCPVMVAREKDFAGLEKTPLPDPAYPAGKEPIHIQRPDVPLHLSTQRVEWTSSDHEGPTGVRIV